MSFEDLGQHVEDISVTMYSEGTRELMATQSPTLLAQEEPKLRQLSFMDVPALYQPFIQTPDPRSLDPMIDDLKVALTTLSTGQDTGDPISSNGGPYFANTTLDQMPAAGDLVETWTGAAAMAFKSKFIDPFPSLVRNQFILVAALKAALEAEQAIWSAARDNIDTIAETTLKALDSMHGCNPTEWTVSFSVVSAVAGLVASVPALGTPAVITFTAVAGAASVAGSASVPDPPELTIKGRTVGDIFDSMYDCVKKEIDEANNSEDTVARALKDIVDTVDSHRDSFVAARPALAEVTTTVTDPCYLGYST